MHVEKKIASSLDHKHYVWSILDILSLLIEIVVKNFFKKIKSLKWK